MSISCWAHCLRTHAQLSRLVANMRRRERVLSSLAIVGSFMGGSGLVLLSIFDTKRYTNLHRIFLLVFIVGVGLSAIFTVIEVSLLPSWR